VVVVAVAVVTGGRRGVATVRGWLVLVVVLYDRFHSEYGV
jgi:hypothetical protein